MSNNESTARGADFVNSLGKAVRENPLPSALIGMGLVWLFAGAKTPSKSGIDAAVGGALELGGRLGEGARNLNASVAGAFVTPGKGVRDGGATMAQRTSDGLSFLSGAFDNQFFSTARSNMSDLLQRQPLVLGAIGLAIGAGVAASLRTTETEVEIFGKASSELQGKARDFGVEQTRRATEVLDGVATTVAQEVRVQGLTSEEAARKVGDVVTAVKGVLNEAPLSVRARLNST
jgi:hypothetical protein